MVQDSGKTLYTGIVKPLNIPVPVNVSEDKTGLPVSVRTSRRRRVVLLEDRWRIDDEWWRNEPVIRFYYAVLLDNGQRIVIFKDLANGRWYQQSC